VFRRGDERVVLTFPADQLQPHRDIAERLVRGDFDDPRRYWLREMAFRIPNANLGGELSGSRTELLPHQILLTHRLIHSPSRRVLVADEVGLGKTIETGMVIRELHARGHAKRVLIICPAGLTENWWEELHDRFGLQQFRILGRDFTDRRGEVWETENFVIASIDTLKLRSHLTKLKAGPDWDLAVFDEAHHLSKKQKTTTQNYKLAEVVRDKARDLLLLSATPHQGDHEHFLNLICLLDRSLFRDVASMLEHRLRLDEVMVRRTKREVTDADGNTIFAKRQVHSESFHLAELERRFYEALSEYLREGYNLSDEDPNDPKRRAIGFVMTTFQKLASSSMRAIRAALLRHLMRLYLKQIVRSEQAEDARLDEYVLDRPQIRDLERKAILLALELEGIPRTEAGRLEAEAVCFREKTAIKRKMQERQQKAEAELAQETLFSKEESLLPLLIFDAIPDEIQKVERLLAILPLAGDSKFDTLVRAIERMLLYKADEKFLIFTQYLATQAYLVDELRKRFGTESVAVIRGGSLDEKIRAARRFRDPQGAQFLVSTSAGGEGINLQVCRILFNYDLPWNPMEVEQRIGRIHRFGQSDTAQVYNLVAVDTVEGRIHLRLEDKLTEIARAIGKVDASGNVAEGFREAILGPLAEALDYDLLYREALRSRDFQRTDDQIEAAIHAARQANEALSGLMQGLEPFNLEKYRRIRGDLTLDHVRDFLRRFLDLHSIRIEEQNGFWAFNTPKVLTGNLPARYERVTFDRSQAITAESVQFVGLGHPLLDAILNHCQDDSFGGEVTVFPPESGVPPHLRVLYQFAFRREEQLVERGLLVVAINQQGAYDTALGSCLPAYVFQAGTPTNGKTRDWLSSAEQVAQLQLEQKHEALRSQHGPNLSIDRRMVGAAVFR